MVLLAFATLNHCPLVHEGVTLPDQFTAAADAGFTFVSPDIFSLRAWRETGQTYDQLADALATSGLECYDIAGPEHQRERRSHAGRSRRDAAVRDRARQSSGWRYASPCPSTTVCAIASCASASSTARTGSVSPSSTRRTRRSTGWATPLRWRGTAATSRRPASSSTRGTSSTVATTGPTSTRSTSPTSRSCSSPTASRSIPPAPSCPTP